MTETKIIINNTEICLTRGEAYAIVFYNFGGYMSWGYHLRHAVGDYLKKRPRGKGVKTIKEKTEYAAARIYWKEITTPKKFKTGGTMIELEVKTVLDIESGQIWYEILEGEYKGIKLKNQYSEIAIHESWLAEERGKHGRGITPQEAILELKNCSR